MRVSAPLGAVSRAAIFNESENPPEFARFGVDKPFCCMIYYIQINNFIRRTRREEARQ